MDGLIFMGALVVLVGSIITWAAWPTKDSKKLDAEVAADRARGWEYVSNSRFGRDMFLCPICGALTVHEKKADHTNWHTRSEAK